MAEIKVMCEIYISIIFSHLSKQKRPFSYIPLISLTQVVTRGHCSVNSGSHLVWGMTMSQPPGSKFH